MRFSSAVLYRKSTLTALLTLIFVSFFGTLTASAFMFGKGYDWRYSVISRLLSPRDNPDHYTLAACGIALSGLLMVPFAGYLRERLRTFAPGTAFVCAASFVSGIAALICACFIVPQHSHEILRIRRMHELLGRTAGGLIAFGMICGCWCAWKGSDRGGSRSLFWIWSLLTLFPLSGIFCSEALLLLTQLEPVRMMPVRAILRHSLFWHLGFWEWTGAAAVFLFLCAAVFLMPEPARARS